MSNVNGQYSVPFPVIQKLTDTGFETVGATTNFNGDYSSTAQDAFIQAAPGLILTVESICISITDSGTFADSDYGNIVDGLVNGISTVIEFNGFEVSSEAATINTNAELFSVDVGAQIVAYSSNDRTLVAAFRFAVPVHLNGDTEDKLILRLSDDMTGLETHEFIAYGSI